MPRNATRSPTTTCSSTTSARNGKHYPLDFRRFQKTRAMCGREDAFHDHTGLCQELIDWVCERKFRATSPSTVYFTNAPILNHIHGEDGASTASRAAMSVR